MTIVDFAGIVNRMNKVNVWINKSIATSEV